MTPPTLSPRRPIFRPVLLALGAACLAGTALAQSPADKAVPANLRAADNEQLAMRLAAIGVQIYECKAAEGKPPQWTFVAPEADLFEPPTMKRVGKHYAGPHWELADGSKIAGAVKQRADAANAGAIPSLLLSAKSAGGPGKLQKITSIQRLNTVGGVAPDAGCTAAELGKQARVYYTADYTFFQPK
jgi:Protein of unknown function (DUF3455)